MILDFKYILHLVFSLRFDARIGAKRVVFGLVTPLDHLTLAPLITSLYIYNIYNLPTHAVTHWVVSGGWSSGVTRPKTIPPAPDPRDKH